MKLSIGFSPCPNDTFMFYGLIKGKVGGGFEFQEVIEDIEVLNNLAIRESLDVTKISIHTLGYVSEHYRLLNSGAALGKGCGPIIVARAGTTLEDLRALQIAVPGRHTTAYLLLGLYSSALLQNTVEMPFNEIMSSIRAGRVGAGVVIHEGRFTYKNYGLKMLLDLGSWWEEKTGLLIPLGGIAVRRALGEKVVEELEELLKRSILYARTYPPGLREYIKSYAQEMEDSVIDRHIELYVNDYSISLGREGRRSIEEFLQRASMAGLIQS